MLVCTLCDEEVVPLAAGTGVGAVGGAGGTGGAPRVAPVAPVQYRFGVNAKGE